MNQRKNSASEQVQYQGRWVSKNNFRVFVYGLEDKKKIVNSYDDYLKALESGDWFASKVEAIPKLKVARKAKNGADG